MRRGLLHHSLDRRRLEYERGDLEKAFADLWEKQNDPVGRDFGTLEHLMIRFDGELVIRGRMPFTITQRDAVIVATIIQWLGTNCGFAFVVHALEKCNYRVVEVRPPKPNKEESTYRLVRID
jgi:hypothetical protein